MGCSGSRSLQTLPVSRRSSPSPVSVSNGDWIVYAPVRHACFYCEKSCMEACGRSYSSSCAHSNKSQWLGNSTCSRRSYSVNSTPFTSSFYSTSSHSSRLDSNPTRTPRPSQESETAPIRTPSPIQRSVDTTETPSPSQRSETSRKYSLLSTPTFHSSSSHPRNGLTLDPSLFGNTLFSNNTSPDCLEGVPNTKFHTDCVSTPTSPHPRNGLTLDPTLFSNSPFSDRVRNTKIDTDCASGFSGSKSPSFESTPSHDCFDKRYPLTPLSVRTEPFPRCDCAQTYQETIEA